MFDIKTKEDRSYNMSRISGKNTKPEKLVRKYLFSQGFRYRKNDRKLPGTPDLVLPKYRTVIFINGCFWHGHEGCKYFVWPKSNVDFWRNKILTNIARDKLQTKQLKKMGWTVLVVWECELRPKTRQATLETLKNKLLQSLKKN